MIAWLIFKRKSSLRCSFWHTAANKVVALKISSNPMSAKLWAAIQMYVDVFAVVVALENRRFVVPETSALRCG